MIMDMIKNNNIGKIELITHNGVFHADDVISTAMLIILCKKYNIQYEITRISHMEKYEPKTKYYIMYDVGKGEYDHHQDKDRPCAAALLFDEIGDDLFGCHTKDFYYNIIEPVDKQDRGIERNPLSYLITAFMPSWKNELTSTEAFIEVVDFMVTAIEKLITKNSYDDEAAEEFNERIKESDGRVLVLPKFIPWQRFLKTHEYYHEDCDIRYVVFPSDGNYKIQTVPTYDESGKMISKEYININEENPDMIFIHPGKFIAGFKTQSTAILAAYESIKNNSVEE